MSRKSFQSAWICSKPVIKTRKMFLLSTLKRFCPMAKPDMYQEFYHTFTMDVFGESSWQLSAIIYHRCLKAAKTKRFSKSLQAYEKQIFALNQLVFSEFSFTTIHESQDCWERGRAFLQLLTTTSTRFTDIQTLAGGLLQTAHLCTEASSRTQIGNLWFQSASR